MRVVVGLIGAAVAMAAMAGVGSAVWASRRGPQLAALRTNTTPVIVELFSSEGCSSCPPADTWLSSVDRTQPVEGVTVLALEEHVDYWDRLGWRDPFARPQFSERQQNYARVLPDRRVFTPEIVVDGRAVIDSNDDEASRAIRASAAEPRAKVTLARQGNRLTVDVSDMSDIRDPAQGDDPAEVWLAITESGLSSDVGTGENAGRRLAHAPVVRILQKLVPSTPSTPSTASTPSTPSTRGVFHADLDAGALVNASWAPGALRFVAFVQRAKSKTIVGASAL